ncbi:MAG TPA: hypothetical protein VKA15_19395 [Isosphaeraceae bacterium]|nr:hypothetical protein [Isosphaeraceae bacterium]
MDRDALLFAAGRGSVRPNCGWITLATLLASTQVLSLVLLWPHSTPPAGQLTVADATVPMPPAALEPGASETLASPGAWSARHRLLESETNDRPDDTVTLIDSGPPLKAFGPLPPSLLN